MNYLDYMIQLTTLTREFYNQKVFDLTFEDDLDLYLQRMNFNFQVQLSIFRKPRQISWNSKAKIQELSERYMYGESPLGHGSSLGIPRALGKRMSIGHFEETRWPNG